MSLVGRAPGKVVLLGEYAVLTGAPGLVAAVAHHAVVRLGDSADGRFWLRSRPPDAPAVGLRLDRRGRLRLAGRTEPAAASAVSATVRAAVATARERAGAALLPATLDLDTRALHAPDGGAKLGLGASAALTVALLGGLLTRAAWLPPGAAGQAALFEAALAAHGRAQGRRGSGIDIAASVYGGLLCYARAPGAAPSVQSLEWPAELAWQLVWTGQPASTPRLLARVAAAGRRDPGRHAAAFAALTAAAQAGCAAIAGGAAAAFLTAAGDFAAALAQLDALAGRGSILTPAHVRLGALAKRFGAVYKPSGAGGGDIGVLFCPAAERADWGRRLAAAGHPPLDGPPARSGFRVTLETDP